MTDSSPVSPDKTQAADQTPQIDDRASAAQSSDQPNLPEEIGGPRGPEPTRYGDWEQNGICRDF